MEKVLVDELNEESLLHFDYINSIENIENKGIQPHIGENAIGLEDTPKVFFSKGELGILKVTEVWLRWLMNRIFGTNDRLGIHKNLTKEEQQEIEKKWIKEFLSGKYKEDEEKKKVLFDYFYKYLKERTYFLLDIKEGEEYSSNDIDEIKSKLNKKEDNLKKAFAKIMYGEFSDINSIKMDDWNMHTKTGIGVTKDKIKQVETTDGKTDMLSIVLYLYEKHKKIPHTHFLLDDFIKYAKKKEELNIIINEEGAKDDKINNNRIY